MIRVHIIHCTLPDEQTRALNRESGRIYTAILVHHYRTYRHSAHLWLSPFKHDRVLKFFCGASSLHAHSYQAAQQDFYEACKTAKALRQSNPLARYPYKRKYYHTTTWKNTGITLKDGRLRLSLARGHDPIGVDLPAHLAALPAAVFRQVQLVYNHATKRSCWHLTVEDQQEAHPCAHTGVMAVDLGEIHPAACTNGEKSTIIACRELRANAQHRNKKTADLQELIARCEPGSRRWKKLVASRKRLQAQAETRQRDMLHKVSRAVIEEAQDMKAGTIVLGDVRDVADKTRVGEISADGTIIKKPKRLSREQRQRTSNWPHGQLRHYITYKAAALSITVELINEAYTSKTCPRCGHLNKPDGRHYQCSECGYVGHRDIVGSTNIRSLRTTGKLAYLSEMLPCETIKYRHPVHRASVVRFDKRRGRATVPVACASKDPKPLSPQG